MILLTLAACAGGGGDGGGGGDTDDGDPGRDIDLSGADGPYPQDDTDDVAGTATVTDSDRLLVVHPRDPFGC